MSLVGTRPPTVDEWDKWLILRMNISLSLKVGLFGTDTLARFLHKIYKKII